MKVKRIVANVKTIDLDKATLFYRDILGLELVMDVGWIRTYATNSATTNQLSFASRGGSDSEVADLSIEVDDLEAALDRFKEANIPLEYGPVNEPWGVRRFYVRDPFDRLINILEHVQLTT